MGRAALVALGLLGALVAGPAAPVGAGIADEDYAPFSARVTDTQGVVLDVEDFGYATGPNVLLAHIGDGDVDVPLRKVRSLEIGAIVDKTRRAPVRAVMRSGKVYALELDNSELTRLFVGESDIGEYRVRLVKVRRLDVLRVVGDPAP